ELAETCLRELVCRATSSKISNIIRPLLTHLDLHDLWVNNEFAVQTFKILMYSLQVQNSVSVIKMLIAHLNDKSNAPAKCRIGIADV
ncbi:UNVERIFIED_CONTAM: hypothetical protein GTU68_032082, partial [Idotea baltica]|nr:hypothetical protein [Idotea baltica]